MSNENQEQEWSAHRQPVSSISPISPTSSDSTSSDLSSQVSSPNTPLDSRIESSRATFVRFPAMSHPTDGDFCHIIRPLVFELNRRYNLNLYPVIESEDTRFILTTIPSGSDAINEYERIRPELIDLLKQSQDGKRQWAAVLLARQKYRLGTEGRDWGATPTIYIAYQGSLDEVLGGLLQLKTKLRMEVHKGKINFTAAQSREFMQEVSGSLSIGVRETNTSGTFGGWVYDKLTGERYGLTCGHVCCGGLADVKESLPCQLAPGIQDKTTIMQPSDQDHIERVLAFEAELPGVNDQVAGLTKRVQDAEGTIPRDAAALRKAEARLQWITDNLRHLRSLDRRLGMVEFATVEVVSRGGSQSHQWKDYGLMRVLQGRQGSSLLLEPSEQHPPYIPDIAGHMEVSGDMEVRKTEGRTTSGCNALVNGVLCTVSLEDSLCRDHKIYQTDEAVLVNLARGGWRNEISAKGDSGSLIVEKDGKVRRVVGLLFGGVETWTSREGLVFWDVSFITPASTLVKWWRSDLGLDLEFGDGTA